MIVRKKFKYTYYINYLDYVLYDHDYVLYYHDYGILSATLFSVKYLPHN